MSPGRWYRISGDAPDLGLTATAAGTRFLVDGDPAQDRSLNPPGSLTERLRRLAGRRWAAPWSGRMGFSAITEAWNGAAWASRFGRCGSMVVFGGGHDDYFGSDVHAFDLAERTWQRLTTGFVSGAPADYGQGAVYPDAAYPDGSPLPPHTYDYLQYDEAGNSLLLLKGQIELGPDVQAVAVPQLFDLDTLTWRRGPRHPWAILNSGGFSTWDCKRRLLWGHSGDDGGGNAFVAFCPDGSNENGSVGEWRHAHPSKLPGEANHNCMQYLPESDLIVLALHRRNALAVIDPRHPDGPLSEVDCGGPMPRLREYAALEHARGLGSLIYYSAADGGTAHAIDWGRRPHWCSLTQSDSLDPVADAAAQSRHHVNRSHTFGRFRVAHFDGVDLAVLVRHVDSPVYALRLRQ